ncbi:MAG: hypothetical protein AAFS10_04785 [Myxococcota bacterium]
MNVIRYLIPLCTAATLLGCSDAQYSGATITKETTPTNGSSSDTSNETTSTSNGTVSTSDGTTSTSDGTTSTSNGTTSTSNGTTSTSDGTTSTSNGTAPTSNGTTSTSNGTTSTSNGTTSTSNGTTPTSNGTAPTSNSTTSTSDGTTGCEPGTLDCSCIDGVCLADEAECHDNVCVERVVELPQIPQDNRCFTPCQGIEGLMVDGAWVECDDGLLEACLDDRVCMSGSCVRPGGVPRHCSNDTQCPPFQRCSEVGLCTVECDLDDDCSDEAHCIARVCRLPCSEIDDELFQACPDDMTCMPTASQQSPQHPGGHHCFASLSEPSALPPPTGFSLSAQTIHLNATPQEYAFAIRNEHEVPQRFTVRWASISVWTEQGRVFFEEEGQCDPVCPSSWITLEGASGPLEVEVPPVQESLVTLAWVHPLHAFRWSGVLEIENARGQIQSLWIHHKPQFWGRWVGEQVHLGHFDARDLELWRENPTETTVSNALLERWSAVRRGQIGWDEFRDVLNAIRTGSWASGPVVEACSSAVCYVTRRHEDTWTIADLSNDLSAVPHAVTESPLVIATFGGAQDYGGNMTLSLTGKVISTASPHLPGHPTIDLSWPTANWIRGDQCHMRAHGTCIEFLQGEIHGATLGGRTFAAEPQDCISPEAPWLVPEFEPTRACQSPDVVAVSPLLDGISRSRQIRTIDGALIDKSLFFLIFEEQIEGFPAPRYSYALLRRTPEPMESWPDPVWSEPTPLDPAPACSEALIDELRESGQNQHVGKTFEEWAINALINRLSPFGPDGWSLLDRIFSYRDVWRAGDAPTRVPSVCSNRNDPYCFDPGQIDEVHSWLSCLTSVPRIEGPHSLADRLEWFMENDFAPAVELGLELMLVLGDDAMIHGLEAPWLEPMPEATFSGSAFEVGGIDAGGLLGAELTALYRATQLYQLALDRGMTLAPALLEAGHNGRALDLLHRASTQKARTWALIGSIYNSIGQVALAHQVAQRATSQHHLEAISSGLDETGLNASIERGTTDGKPLHDLREISI